MKRLGLFFSLLAVLLSCQKLVVTQEEQSGYPLTKSFSEEEIESPLVFMADTCFSRWVSIKGLSNRFDACEVPDSVLNRMSTDALVKSVIHFPLNYIILFFNDPISGVNLISKKSSLHKEFVSRSDAGSYLVSYYSSSRIDKTKHYDDRDEDYATLSPEDMFFLENYLCTDEVLRLLSMEEKEALRSILPRRIKERETDDDLCCEFLLKPLLRLNECVNSVSFSPRFSEDMTRSYFSTIRTTFQKPVIVYVNDEMPDYLVSLFTYDAVLNHPDATLVSPASNVYNCHSYAWILNDASENVWLNSINPQTGAFQLDNYWTNDLFVELQLSTNATRVYYNASDPVYDHSAIMLPSGKLRSKWGPGPVMEHDWDDVPNEYLDNLTSLRYFAIRDTPLLNPHTIHGDSNVAPNTSHNYYSSNFYGISNVWSVQYLNSPTSPFSFTYLNSDAGGTYSLSCQEYGAYKKII